MSKVAFAGRYPGARRSPSTCFRATQARLHLTQPGALWRCQLDLGPAVFRENARRCHVTVHFGSVEDIGVREALREFLYARLRRPTWSWQKASTWQCPAGLQSRASFLRVRPARTGARSI